MLTTLSDILTTVRLAQAVAHLGEGQLFLTNVVGYGSDMNAATDAVKAARADLTAVADAWGVLLNPFTVKGVADRSISYAQRR